LYFFLSTTIHPWYVINFLALGVFTNKKYIYFWSFLVFLSYFTYSQINFKENYYLIFLEYAIVIGCFIYETRKSVLLNFETKKKLITEL
jgi:alpha-1,6-mannosyltransferase